MVRFKKERIAGLVKYRFANRQISAVVYRNGCNLNGWTCRIKIDGATDDLTNLPSLGRARGRIQMYDHVFNGLEGANS